MEQYEFIRTGYRVYGKSISELSRITGHSRNTIKKAIRGEPWGYKEREHQAFPVLGPYMGIIDRWLEEDKGQPIILLTSLNIYLYNLHILEEVMYDAPGEALPRTP